MLVEKSSPAQTDASPGPPPLSLPNAARKTFTFLPLRASTSKRQTRKETVERKRGHLSLCDQLPEDKRPKGVSPRVRAGQQPVARVRTDV